MADPRHKDFSVGKFWGTQPVPKSRDEIHEVEDVGEPIDVPKDHEVDIRKTPLNLPDNFEWYNPNIDNEAELDEIYSLLRDHYVEDEDNMFRFDYSRNFLKWALKPPGFTRDWHLAVKGKKTGKVVGFITGIPVTTVLYGKEHKMAEINFLCVHQKLRSNRLAPVLIREITRRINLTGIFQAVYTAGITIPTPIASCQYWHRNLNPKKLIDIKFSQLKKGMTMARTIKQYKLPAETSTPGLRPLRKEDVASACRLLMGYLAKFKIYVHFTEEEFEHWFLPREGVIDSHVVENAITHEITDLISFYSLPSTVINHPRHHTLFAAYSWYNVATTVPLSDLMKDSLILAKKKDYDVFNCLELHDNSTFLKDLEFGPGDGFLQFYVYNWRCKSMEPNQVGIVLL